MSTITKNLTDEQCMTAYATGDERGFDPLFRTYAPMLARYFARHGQRPNDIADLVQQTFLHMHRARADYRSGEPVRPWLFTIARNVSHDSGRRRQRRPETLCDVDVHEAPNMTTEHIIHAERTRALSNALEQLPEDHRSLLNEHWFEDRSWSEIARRDGSHAGTLRVRAHRACLQLRSLIRGDHFEAA